MFDMSWGEVMLIGGVALIVIGPKDLPKALRTVGQVTGKLRRMAGEFQAQFNEAIREAELDEARREFDGIRDTVRKTGSGFNPVQTIRDELKGAVEGRAEKSQDPHKPGPDVPAEAPAHPAAAPSPGSYDVPRPAEMEAAPLPVPGSVDDPFGAPEPPAAPSNPVPAAPAGEAKPGTAGQ
jgi:sec-independent protein translocase protein TatB